MDSSTISVLIENPLFDAIYVADYSDKVSLSKLSLNLLDNVFNNIKHL